MTDLEIAHATKLAHIDDVAAHMGIVPDELEHYGKHIAKLPLSLMGAPKGKLILVTAITATKAGIGKTTVSIGLALGLNRIGKKAVVALREPSLGPCFGMKGGAAGGGHAQVLPMERINLHFTGDFHAITSAHNMISALLDNYLYQHAKDGFGLKEILWRRVLDVNDRSLRSIVTGLGPATNGLTQQAGFDITPASELMAPNLVQTTEQTPAIVHGGPFANIAHGCNSLFATRMALSHSDYTITEAGFGADLGAEKFYNILCRKSGLQPALAVIVATAQGLKMHGGVALDAIKEPNLEGLRTGLANLDRHVKNLRSFGQSVVVVFNRFATDTDEEMALLKAHCEETLKAPFVINNAYAEGGKGAEEMAHLVVDTIENNPSQPLKFTYDDNDDLRTKIEKVAKTIYGAASVTFAKPALNHIKQAEALGMNACPVCIAKTQFSFSADAKRYGAVEGFDFLIRDVVLNAGAEMVVAIAGDILRMPGLPRDPQANHIDYVDGEIIGLS